MRTLKAPPLSRKAPPLSRSVVAHHVTHSTHAVIGKEDSGGASNCEHSLSSRLSSLLALCVPAPRDTHKIPQRRRFKSRRPHQGTHTTHTQKLSELTVQFRMLAPLDPHTHIAPQRRRFKLRCSHQLTHTHNYMNDDGRRFKLRRSRQLAGASEYRPAFPHRENPMPPLRELRRLKRGLGAFGASVGNGMLPGPYLQCLPQFSHL